MATFNLAAIVKRQLPGIRRHVIVLRDIVPPAVLATDLYRTLYLPPLEAWAASIPRILAEYERSLSTMTTDSPSDIGAEIDQTERELRRLVLSLIPALRRWTWRVESWFRGRFRGAILTATGIDLATMLGPEAMRETVETFIQRNVALVRSVSDQARDRIADTVFRGLQQRRPVADVARDLREAVDMGRGRARRIAQDQLSKLSGALADERRREAGLTVWQWVHSRKRHPREEHKARDGNYYSDDPAMVGRTVDGKVVRAPPPPGDRPTEPPFCGCRGLGVLVLE